MVKNFDQPESLKIKFHCRHQKYVPFESTSSIKLKTGLSVKIAYIVLEKFWVENWKISKKDDFFSKKNLSRQKSHQICRHQWVKLHMVFKNFYTFSWHENEHPRTWHLCFSWKAILCLVSAVFLEKLSWHRSQSNLSISCSFKWSVRR